MVSSVINDIAEHNGDRQVWAAVVERAMLDLEYIECRREAMAWLKSSNDTIGLFIWACHQIDQETNTIRKAILATPFAREAPNKYWDKQRHFLRLNKMEETAKKREEAAREKAA